MIFGCLADEYGYRSDTEYDINAGLFHVASPVGSGLSQNVCPYGYNKRLLDQVYGFNQTSGQYASNYTGERWYF
jgi:hypothetical protein